MSDAVEWSLCLTSRQGRKIVQLPPTASTRDLYQIAKEQFGSNIASLKYGFPPKLAASSDEQAIQSILQNQERIQVEFDTAEKSKSTSKGNGGKAKQKQKQAQAAKAVASPPPTTGRSKRAAAQRATENMQAVIKEQEKLLKEQQPSKSSKRQRINTSNASSPSRGAAAAPASSRRPTKPAPARFTASVGQGRRLADGATVSAPKSRKRASPSLAAPSTQASDMSEALLGALNDSGKMGQVLRRGMKNAVQASYETSSAFSRLAAVQAKTFTMTTRDNAGSSVLHVSYQGSVDKTKTEEQVDCIPRDVLEAVLRGIHASTTEALRPENLALLSPRVLWSLVHIFPEHSSVPDMYKELLPDLAWNFLRRRAQQLSEKAMENLRQEQEAKGEDEGDGARAAEAISAVEHAMENLHDYSAAERQTRQAQAAMMRFEAVHGTSESDGAAAAEWKLVTPTEPDRDELRQCLEGTASSVVTSLINKLMRECQIHNWRELANVDNVQALAEKLGVLPSNVQVWVDRAQDQSVDEIIVEVCDGNIRAVELLTETARSGTPKDLAVWRNIPQLLHQRMTDKEGAPSMDELRTWSGRAHELLQEYEWLNWYATPVE